MFRMTIISLMALALGGCVSVPNVYQPEGTGCSEIEYRWTNGVGQHQAFYDGSGGFCTSIPLDFSQDTPLQARCVIRGPSGEIVQSSSWVDSMKADDEEEFRKLCPVD